jgi:hypothetical protein
MYSNPEIMKEITPKYSEENKRSQRMDANEDVRSENDDIINIQVSRGNHVDEGDENYESMGNKASNSKKYEDKWYNKANIPGAQETITGLSDIRGTTISLESEANNTGRFDGTITSLVEIMNQFKNAKGRDMYLMERETMYFSDPLLKPSKMNGITNLVDEKQVHPHYNPSYYSSGNQTAYFNSDAEIKTKNSVNPSPQRKLANYENSKEEFVHMKNSSSLTQVASKQNIETDEILEDPDENEINRLYDSPIKNYQSELYQIQEEMPYSSTSMVSERRTDANRTRHAKNDSLPTSTYYSLMSNTDNLNETFLL